MNDESKFIQIGTWLTLSTLYTKYPEMNLYIQFLLMQEKRYFNPGNIVYKCMQFSFYKESFINNFIIIIIINNFKMSEHVFYYVFKFNAPKYVKL